MSMLYRSLVKPLLFRMDPERAHHLIVDLLKIAQSLPLVPKITGLFYSHRYPSLESIVLARKFSSPVGLAAGFDKNCELVSILPSFGFGFIECGTITALAQPGNPKPRMFRLEKEQALINRLGFNNHGADWVGKNLKGMKMPQVPLGINIGKSRVTSLDKAPVDYLLSFEALYPYGDYFTVNVSSPNTPGLRDLQKNLTPLLSTLQKKNEELAVKHRCEVKNLFVKISPDLSLEDLDLVVESAISNKVAGMIVSNTTLSRDKVQLESPIEGGLSGRPLEEKSTELLRQIYKRVGRKIVIIGVGGIFTAEDVYRKVKAGATLVQLYTSWVYNGPSHICAINRDLANLLKRDGIHSIKEAIGIDNK